LEISGIRKKIANIWIQYRYVLLIIVIGIFLMLIPSNTKSQEEDAVETNNTEALQPQLSEQLEDVLSQIEGAGNVRVILTEAAGEETIYQTDSNTDSTGDSGSSRIETVIITDAQRTQSGLICQVNPKKYLGAVIVCRGADSPQVKLAIVEAVSKVTGLPSNRISVLKMK